MINPLLILLLKRTSCLGNWRERIATLTLWRVLVVVPRKLLIPEAGVRTKLSSRFRVRARVRKTLTLSLLRTGKLSLTLPRGNRLNGAKRLSGLFGRVRRLVGEFAVMKWVFAECGVFTLLFPTPWTCQLVWRLRVPRRLMSVACVLPPKSARNWVLTLCKRLGFPVITLLLVLLPMTSLLFSGKRFLKM